MFKTLKQLLKNLNTTPPKPIEMSDNDIDLIKSVDSKIVILDKCLCSNYYNYMIMYEKTKVEYHATIFVFSAHATAIDPHKPTRIWREKFKTGDELNNILHRFFIR
jgi:hypothetical protein